MLTLSSREQAALAHGLEVLSSPLTFAEPRSWMRSTLTALRDLFRSQEGFFLLPRPGGPEATWIDVPSPWLEAYVRHYHRLDRGHAIARRRGLAVSTHEELYGPELRRGEYFNDFLLEIGAARVLGMSHQVGSGRGAGVLAFYRDSLSRPAFGERERALARLVYPAFRGALEMDVRLRRLGDTVGAILDREHEALALLDGGGRVLQVNGALRALLEQDAAARLLEDALETMGDAARPAGIAPPASRVVAGERGRYRLDATLLSDPGGGRPHRLVAVTPLFSVWPTDARLRRRFGLTPRQCEVARLLAEGRTDREVADELGISIHTAHRHAEAVLRKLGLGSRILVGRRLREADGKSSG